MARPRQARLANAVRGGPPAPAPAAPSGLAAAVLDTVRRIPRGRVATYGDVADRVGRPGAARAVARVLAEAEVADVPYHRVVSAGGHVRGSSAAERARRLRLEGIRLRGGRVLAFAGLRARAR